MDLDGSKEALSAEILDRWGLWWGGGGCPFLTPLDLTFPA